MMPGDASTSRITRSSNAAIYPQTQTRATSPSLTPPPEYIPQPDHFYTNSTSSLSSNGHGIQMNVTRNLRPEDDAQATRGIPVFKPSWWEFADFEAYMKSIEPWGMRSGIVKVIPPKQWIDSLPDPRPFMQNIKIRHPIEQNMVGRSGLFRQQNIEKRRVYSLREWFEVGLSEEYRTPRGDEVTNRDRAREQGSSTRAKRIKKEGSLPANTREPSIVWPLSPSPSVAPGSKALSEHEEAGEIGDDNIKKEDDAMDLSSPFKSLHSASTYITGHSLVNGTSAGMERTLDEAILTAKAQKAAQKVQERALKAARAAQKSELDETFLSTFDPRTSWLPPGATAEDYEDFEYLTSLERIYWRSCGVGKESMYGADLPGSLFSTNLGASLASGNKENDEYAKGIDKTWRVHNPAAEKPKSIPWDVSNLPSALTRLLPRGTRMPGVNTPYLYFGLWRATFAWHVEDCDLFSINYLHWGAPKHWYAVPQARANALEQAMKTFFPTDKNGCPQFLRHKSYLASPTVLRSASIKPNTLVQNAGEFVITFPRGYHAGFNTGLNCAESVNFALDSWLDLGRKAKFCTCVGDSVRIDVDALLAEKERIEAEERAGMRRPPTELRQARIRPAAPPQAHVAPPGGQRKRRLSQLGTPTPSTSTDSATKRVKREVSTDALPCCLCVSSDKEGLLTVNDRPWAIMGLPTPRNEAGDEDWKAHAACASIVAETWVDDIEVLQGDGTVVKERRVFGVDAIPKERWGLRCGACTDPDLKAYGAKIQCTKGKCSKSFHVGCAKDGKAGSAFKVVEELELEVLVNSDAVGAPDAARVDSGSQLVGVNGTLLDGSQHRVLKTIKKLSVELLCGQHNPSLSDSKRKVKTEQIHQALLALPANARVKIKLPSGIFECTLVGFDRESETIQVLWSNGERRLLKWSTIVWGKGLKGLPAISTASTSQDTTLQPTKPSAKAKPQAPPPQH